MLVLGRAQVEALLDLDTLIDALASAMADLSAGRASSPDRVAALIPERDGFLAAMPGFVPSAGVLMSKLVSVFPRNGGTPLPTHQALIAVFDPHTGEPAALLDGTAITAARTAACSALSARLLAREDASVLAVLGTGAQARSHAEAMCRVRPIRQIRVAGRDRAKARALADALSSELQVPTEATATYAEALDGAEIAAATTHAVDPVIRRSWLTPGVHVTSVGFNPDGREIDDANGYRMWPRWCGVNGARQRRSAGPLPSGHRRRVPGGGAFLSLEQLRRPFRLPPCGCDLHQLLVRRSVRGQQQR
ncbi:ornithine cyclodeaminase family protein [Streptomyces sp. NPDC054765]